MTLLSYYYTRISRAVDEQKSSGPPNLAGRASEFFGVFFLRPKKAQKSPRTIGRLEPQPLADELDHVAKEDVTEAAFAATDLGPNLGPDPPVGDLRGVG